MFICRPLSDVRRVRCACENCEVCRLWRYTWWLNPRSSCIHVYCWLRIWLINAVVAWLVILTASCNGKTECYVTVTFWVQLSALNVLKIYWNLHVYLRFVKWDFISLWYSQIVIAACSVCIVLPYLICFSFLYFMFDTAL